jgi:hypothetical protein
LLVAVAVAAELFFQDYSFSAQWNLSFVLSQILIFDR